ncbi:hypothetical protein SDC9_42348 [bioreactor metagenome]|uniref:Uncharacterized protein n=1 Tax=bioreactor metagenome TaxID=1076179 RepID=A0A644W0T0_9ZZZZ
MILSRHNAPCFPGIGEDELLIQGFDGMHVDYCSLIPLLREQLSCLEGLGNQDGPQGYDGDVASVGKHFAFAQGEWFTLFVQRSDCLSVQAHVHASFNLCRCFGQCLEADGVGRLDDGQARYHAHQTDVFERHVRSPVECCTDAGICSHQFDIQFGIVG